MIPALNDEEIPALLQASAQAGAQFVGSTVVRLPFSVKEIFAAWLDQHYPQRKEKVLGRIRAMQGPTLSHHDFGTRLKGEGFWADQIQQLTTVSLKRAGLHSSRRVRR
jgi:DNA repair photolyase